MKHLMSVFALTALATASAVGGTPLAAWQGERTIGGNDAGVLLDWSDRPVGAATVCVQYERGSLSAGRLRGRCGERKRRARGKRPGDELAT